jgi:hypothetical protein
MKQVIPIEHHIASHTTIACDDVHSIVCELVSEEYDIDINILKEFDYTFYVQSYNQYLTNKVLVSKKDHVMSILIPYQFHVKFMRGECP